MISAVEAEKKGRDDGVKAKLHRASAEAAEWSRSRSIRYRGGARPQRVARQATLSNAEVAVAIATIQALKAAGDHARAGVLTSQLVRDLDYFVRLQVGRFVSIFPGHRRHQEDLLQCAREALLRMTVVFDPQRGFSFFRAFRTLIYNAIYAYLYEMDRIAYDAANHRRRHAAELSRAAAECNWATREDHGDPGARWDEIRMVRQAIARLDPIDAEIIRRHRLDGYGLDEIASRLGISYAAARKREQRAIALLRQMLAGDD